SDALGGVVNIVLKENIEGAFVDVGYVGAGDGDGEERNASVMFGFRGDRTTATASLSYFDSDPIYSRDRDWSSEPDFTNRGGPDGRSADSSPPTLILDDGRVLSDPACDEHDRDVIVPGEIELCRFNWARETMLNSPAERLGAMGRLAHEPSDTSQLLPSS